MIGRLAHPETGQDFVRHILSAIHDFGKICLCLVVIAFLEIVDTRGIQQFVINLLQFRALFPHGFETAEGFIVFLRVKQQIDSHLLHLCLALRFWVAGDVVIQQSHRLVEGVGTRDKTQAGIIKQGLLADFGVKASGIGGEERVAGIFRLIGFGITRCQIVRGKL